MKRVLAGLAVVASLLLTASPVAAADTNHYRTTGSGADASWTNVPMDGDVIPPGTYFQTSVIAANQIEGGLSVQDTFGNGLCVEYWIFTVDAEGNFTDDQWVRACDTAAQMTLDKRLGSDHLVGTVPVMECSAFDDTTGECAGEWVQVGTFAVDLTLTGIGRIYRSHSADSGGTAGMYQYTMHGTTQQRMAVASGTVTYNGTSIIAGATSQGAQVWASKNGYVDITICNPKNGC